jgi:MYXO-CTERM domain-containing protein
MACGCKDEASPPGTWRYLPDDSVPMNLPTLTVGTVKPAESQPGRAPAAAPKWPAWAWVLLALVAFVVFGKRGEA